MRDLLGGKGANLAEMTNSGAPVPHGFTITTEACNAYSATGQFPEGMMAKVWDTLAQVERQSNGKRFGDPENPLLVSVRSGAKFSMPGMMDTVLNLGLNTQTMVGLAKKSGDPRFAADAYRRFIQLYGSIVLDVPKERFDHIMNAAKFGGRQDTDLNTDELNDIIGKYKALIRQETGKAVPEDPREQLEKAIAAVFSSWNGRRAIDYRSLENIPDDLGTAVNIQSMVFGNMGNDSATGVAFSRNPSTGEPVLFGEYLVNAQGEDVVAGIRTPRPISEMERDMPEVYRQFCEIVKRLEEAYCDMQDMEFTVEKGILYMLQTRNGKRTIRAAIRIAVDLANEGKISREEAVLRVDAQQLDQLLHRIIVPEAKKSAVLLTIGLPASPGAASGVVVFDPDKAVELAKNGPVILVRKETSPEDFHGMVAADGVLTEHGGMTSHAGVVMRGMGKCCVAGASELKIDYDTQTFVVNGSTFKKGDIITLDGATGEVFAGQLATQEPVMDEYYHTFMSWVDEFRTIKVRANIDTPEDARKAREHGAQGGGLTRTEHMFFEDDRIDTVREMILAETTEERQEALVKIEAFQRKDFKEILSIMDGLPLTIRLLDPPLHEFLPNEDEKTLELAEKLRKNYALLKSKVESLREYNPMLGTRGCRLGISLPEITEMQARAIFTAAKLVRDEGIKVLPEVMIPLVITAQEFLHQKAIIDRVAQEVGFTGYLVGTMIETPRAALIANEIAEKAEFFSFGTNDLTQMTLGLSRDDTAQLIQRYKEAKILANDPFQVLDQKAVGKLVEIATELGRKTNPKLKVGVCGEHGGEPSSVEFFVRTGLDYVSCSPYRVPIARLAAAQAALRAKSSTKETTSTR